MSCPIASPPYFTVKNIFLCVWVFCGHVCLCITSGLVPRESRRHWPPGPGGTDSSELLCGAGGSKLGSLEEQSGR